MIRPRERPGDIQVVYDAVDAPEATLRSLVTIPNGNTRKLPAILFLQGFDCSSVDWPLPEPNLTRELIYRLTRAGFVVMRSEKSGVGDSTGTACRDVGFRDEVSLFTSALRKLKSYDFVDSENVFLFGHSAGGWVAPLVAAVGAGQGHRSVWHSGPTLRGVLRRKLATQSATQIATRPGEPRGRPTPDRPASPLPSGGEELRPRGHRQTSRAHGYREEAVSPG